MKKLLIGSSFLAASLLVQHLGHAGCRIHNDTSYDFKVESGNTSNQSVGAHTTTTIASGKIKGVDAKAGKTISGSCKDGDELEVKDDHGTPVLSVK